MYERLLDKDLQPTLDQLREHCGGNGARFACLNEVLSRDYGTAQTLRFPYGKHYGWCVTHRLGKKLVCDIFAEAGAFTVMCRLSNQQFAAVYAQVGPDTQACITGRYPCGDGGWIHYRVTGDSQLADIQRILAQKLE